MQGHKAVRRCAECGDELSARRLEAQPDATMCVKCLNDQGDVDKIKKFDDVVNGEVVDEVFYTDDVYIQKQIERRGTVFGFSSAE